MTFPSTRRYLHAYIEALDNDLSRALLERRPIHGTERIHIGSCDQLEPGPGSPRVGQAQVRSGTILDALCELSPPGTHACSCIDIHLGEVSFASVPLFSVVVAGMNPVCIDPPEPTLIEQEAHRRAAKGMRLFARDVSQAMFADLNARADAMEPTVAHQLDEHGPAILSLLLEAKRDFGEFESLTNLVTSYRMLIRSSSSTSSPAGAGAVPDVLAVTNLAHLEFSNTTVTASLVRVLKHLFERPDGSLLLPDAVVGRLGQVHPEETVPVPAGTSAAVLDTAVVLHRDGAPLDRALAIALDLES